MAENIHEAIVAIYEKVEYVQKERKQGLSYTFAGEAALLDAIRPAMVENKVYAHVAGAELVADGEYHTTKGSRMGRAAVLYTVRFTHAPSQTSIDAMAFGEGADVGDKTLNKAMTGAYKYALRQTFAIITGDDPDASASEPRGNLRERLSEPAPSPNGGHLAQAARDMGFKEVPPDVLFIEKATDAMKELGLKWSSEEASAILGSEVTKDTRKAVVQQYLADGHTLEEFKAAIAKQGVGTNE